jgi:hypothetical protein
MLMLIDVLNHFVNSSFSAKSNGIPLYINIQNQAGVSSIRTWNYGSSSVVEFVLINQDDQQFWKKFDEIMWLKLGLQKPYSGYRVAIVSHNSVVNDVRYISWLQDT